MKDRFSFQVSLAGGLFFLIQLVCIWAVPVFYTQDGPAHAYSATVFLECLDNPDGLAAETYELNGWQVPTWMGSMLLVVFVQVFGPLIGEKFLISLTLISLAGGFYCLLRGVVPRARWGWVLILPFLLNHLLLMGLYFFLLATGAAMIFLGWAWNLRSVFGWRETGISAVCLLLCFHLHPVPPALAGGALFLHFILPDSYRRSWGRRLSDTGRLALAGLPCVLWSLFFLLSSSESGPVATGRGFLDVFEDIVAVAVLAPFTKTPHLWAVFCFALMAAISIRCLATWVRREDLPRNGGLFLFFGASLFFLSAVVPEGVRGGTLMGYRVGFLFWLVWLAWLVVEVERTRWSFARIALVMLFLCAAGFQTVRVWDRQKAIQPFLADLKTVSRSIAAETCVWPLVFNLQGKAADDRLFSPRNPLFSHAGLRYLDARNGQVAAIAYQGEVGHFATRFRDLESHSYFRDGFEGRPGAFDLQPEVGDVVLLIGGALKFAGNKGVSWKALAEKSTDFGPLSAIQFSRP